MDQWAADSVKKLKVDDLIPNDRNPKIHPDTQVTQLANSIREWGWTMPILVDEENSVIAGHGRLFAAKELGLEEVPCMTAKGWTKEQKRAYIIADNKLAENSQWDTGMYFSELKEMSNEGYDLTKMGVEIDLSSFNYSPNLMPSFDASEIDEGKMVSAAQRMEDNQNNRMNSQQGTDVVCPECGEEFTFTGN
tara:strand:+ start:4300 stop:4875 length:576 start_codon:yes stop_codon:yes gene_type:complete